MSLAEAWTVLERTLAAFATASPSAASAASTSLRANNPFVRPSAIQALTGSIDLGAGEEQAISVIANDKKEERSSQPDYWIVVSEKPKAEAPTTDAG